MFRIVCFVEDKALPKVLHAVAGLVVNMEPPQPVQNAVIEKVGKVKQIKQESNATSIKGRLIEWLDGIKGSRITSTDVKNKYTELGGNPNGVNGQLTMDLVKKHKVLKRISRGQFAVI